MERIDARGLSCPQPVLLTMARIKSGLADEFEILVDTETSCENVSRAAKSAGWLVKEVTAFEKGYKILVGRG